MQRLVPHPRESAGIRYREGPPAQMCTGGIPYIPAEGLEGNVPGGIGCYPGHGLARTNYSHSI